MKNIVVIGSSRGIGKALVSTLSKNNTVLALSRNIDKLSIFSENKNVTIAKFDVSTDTAKQDLTQLIQNTFKSVDVLINNAGVLVNKPILEITKEDIDLSYNTNVFGLIQSCQATIPFMEQAGGHIVNIGSMGGFQGSSKFPGLSVYSSSKAAVASFTECLAEELKETKIKANCLALGAAQTEMLEEAFPGYEAPLSANEMAEFIADFSLNSSKWINGKVLPISVSTP
jgi:NAD(P)-dependent dehydrogenase (short-subunit alcohol dehydrogenase family)